MQEVPKHQQNFRMQKLMGTNPSIQTRPPMASTHVMPVHGLIHDGQLRACPSCLLGLMYAFRVSVRY
jgi:hypothetical protein